jgi:hypothetical protein
LIFPDCKIQVIRDKITFALGLYSDSVDPRYETTTAESFRSKLNKFSESDESDIQAFFNNSLNVPIGLGRRMIVKRDDFGTATQDAFSRLSSVLDTQSDYQHNEFFELVGGILSRGMAFSEELRTIQAIPLNNDYKLDSSGANLANYLFFLMSNIDDKNT